VKLIINHLTQELNPSAQRCLPRFFTGILVFKGLTERRFYKSFGVKGLRTYALEAYEYINKIIPLSLHELYT
jgi:hypothetical protein